MMAFATTTVLGTAAAPDHPFNTTLIDCGVRRLIHRRAVALQPWRGALTEVFEALELAVLCGDAPPTDSEVLKVPRVQASTANVAEQAADVGFTAFVCPRHGDDGRGAPFATVAAALDAARRSGAPRRSIVLRQGVHFLNTTLTLGPQDSGTTITSASGEEVWLSGGRAIPVGAPWKRLDGSSTVWSLELDDLPAVPGFFSLEPTAKGGADAHRRFTRARFPNGDAELTQWGYASQGRYNVSLPAAAVHEWHRPPEGGKVPRFAYVDLSRPGNPSGALKNDSTMAEYNSWGSSVPGGAVDDVCAQVWDKTEPSYWCGNNSAGGWAEVDRQAAQAGQLGIPIGVTFAPEYQERFNCSWTDGEAACNSKKIGPRLARWSDPTGAIVHAWHSQSWAMHMFEVAGAASATGAATAGGGFDRAGSALRFSRGGWQGGRNWCRCDQCGYAGKWCTQHQQPPPSKPDTRLIGGDFFIESIFEELDEPGEWFFNESTRTLYFWPNSTSTDGADSEEGQQQRGAGRSTGEGSADPSQQAWSVPVLQRLIAISGTKAKPVTDVTITGVGFRDAAATFMDPRWAPPSGGDWSLHRGGAVFVEGAERIDVDGCHFRRLDGNALFLSRYTRNVSVAHSTFEWIGDGAMATWGETDEYDATAGEQPRFTTVRANLVRELGLYEKQSSAWGQAKACQSTIEDNIFFNMPRAAINFNDNLGGGNMVRNNLIFNTCRESGDHGPINSWDRMPFLTELVPDAKGRPSFTPLPNEITRNLIVANYGASQGVDNDDGSSFYQIHDNFFFGAEGFKMDYGGHNSQFDSNLVMVYPYDGSNCINVGSFKRGVGDAFRNNTCLSGIGEWAMSSGCGSPACANRSRPAPPMDVVGHVGQCDPAYTTLADNSYYTPHGNATLQCGGGGALTIAGVQRKHGNELGSRAAKLPTAAEALSWAEAMVTSWPLPAHHGRPHDAPLVEA